MVYSGWRPHVTSSYSDNGLSKQTPAPAAASLIKFNKLPRFSISRVSQFTSSNAPVRLRLRIFQHPHLRLFPPKRHDLFLQNDVTSAKTHPRISFLNANISSRAVGDGRGEIRRDRSSRTRNLDRPALRDDSRPASCQSARYIHTYIHVDR